MAIINKTGITNGGTIEAEHITRIIDALSSGSSEIAATGSLTGSLLGTASFATTASFALNAIGSGTEYATLQLSSGAISGVTSGSFIYVGTQVTASIANQVGVPIPFNGTIVSASVYLNTPSSLNTTFTAVTLNLNNTGVITFGNLDPKNKVRDFDIKISSASVSTGDWLDIVIRPATTTTGLTFVAADILIKKS